MAVVGLLLSASGAFCQSWTIGNEQIERTVTFDPAIWPGYATAHRSRPPTRNSSPQVRPVRRPALEFSFACNGQSLNGSTFRLVKADEEHDCRTESLSPSFSRARRFLWRYRPSTTCTMAIQPSANIWFCAIRVPRSFIFHTSNIEAIAPSVRQPENETTLNTQYGTIPREIFYTGRSEDAGLLVANGRAGIGFAILSEVPGYMKRTEIGGWNDPEHVHIGVLYDTDLMPFERSVGPGHEFETAAVSLVTYRNGDGFRDPHWILPSYTSKILMRRIDEKGAPWIYNTWEPFERGINREPSCN